jgi:hypothetical protein
MDERERLLREIFGDNSSDERTERPINTRPLFQLREIWPDGVARLKTLLRQAGESQLAETVEGLWVFDRCDCGADYFATVYTQPRPRGGFGPDHRNIVFWNPDTVDLDTGKTVAEQGIYPTTKFTTILDVCDEIIMCIEILHDDESRGRLIAALPDFPKDSEQTP